MGGLEKKCSERGRVMIVCAFLVGLVAGAACGGMVISLCAAARCGDCQSRRFNDEGA